MATQTVGWAGTANDQGAPVVANTTGQMDANTQALRGQMVDLLKTTTEAYNKLMQGGRENDAFALRDAMERFSRAGTQAGISPWARTQAINDLRARMAAAANTLQGTVTANALSAQGNILGNIGNLDAQTKSAWADQQRIGLERSKLLWDQQQAAQARADRLKAQADAKAEADRNRNTPVATPKTNPRPTANTPLATPAAAPAGNWQQTPTNTGWVGGGIGTPVTPFPKVKNYPGGTQWGMEELARGYI